MRWISVLTLGLFLANAQTPTPIYNNIPSPLPPSLTSQSFEALPYHYSEFGNLVAFGGTDRHLTSVTVAMVTLAYRSKYGAPATSTGWTEQALTLTIYSVGSGNQPGSVIASFTRSFPIPWRPEPTPLVAAGRCGWPLMVATTAWRSTSSSTG
jgi:hypothetical protein